MGKGKFFELGGRLSIFGSSCLSRFRSWLHQIKGLFRPLGWLAASLCGLAIWLFEGKPLIEHH